MFEVALRSSLLVLVEIVANTRHKEKSSLDLSSSDEADKCLENKQKLNKSSSLG